MHGNMQKHARVAQLVERDLAKVEAAGSSPVSRSFYFMITGFGDSGARYFCVQTKRNMI